jgi:hypothetical protein
MKNYLTLVLALSVVSAPAFASRARLESLGEGKNGSYYIDDSRNIFLNPAQIVHYKKKLFLETGVEPAGQDVAVTGNRAQGGFTNTFGDFTYGVYMNQTSERTLATVAGANALGLPATFISPDSTVEAFFAGEAGVNWGISVFYAGNDIKTAAVEKTFSQLGARLGIDMNALQIFTTVGITSKSNINDGALNNNELKAKVGIDGGVTYKMNDMTVFGKFTMIGADVNTVTPTELRASSYGVGAGWKHEMTKSTNTFVRTEIDVAKSGVANVAGGETKSYNLPVVVGAESQALSWLAIRGSVAESILGASYTVNTRNSLAGTTTVSLGLGLTFGDVQIDGLVATTGASNTANGIAGFGTAPQTDTTFGFGKNMLSRVAVTYNF